jgi:redox-sensitive bicupin YhaK (pirin superfamily)
MLPNQKGGKPIYEEKQIDQASVNNKVRVLFSGDGREKSSIIRQNAVFGYGQIDSGKQLEIELDEKLPNLWIQIISGSCKIKSFSLNKADGLAVENVNENILIYADKCCKFFVFQLPNDS